MKKVLLAVGAVLWVAACASTQGTGGPALPPRVVDGGDGLYSLELSRSLRERKAPNEHYDTFFAFPRRDWIVGVIIDAPAQGLDALDISAAGNANASGFPVELVGVEETALGGLVAHRSEFMLEPEPGEYLLMLNTHTSTAEENVQLIIAGPAKDAELLRVLATEFEDGGFSFAVDVKGLRAVPPYDLADPRMPIVFGTPPGEWSPIRPGTLNDSAFLEMFVPGHDLWFMGLSEVLTPEQEQEVAGDADYFARLCTLTHDEMASGLKAVPPGNLAPFDHAGGEPDVRWSLGGLFEESSVAVTYRFRVIKNGAEVVRLYCWGQVGQDVKARCDGLFDNIDLRSVRPSVGTDTKEI